MKKVDVSPDPKLMNPIDIRPGMLSLRCWLFGHRSVVQMGVGFRWCSHCGKILGAGSPW